MFDVFELGTWNLGLGIWNLGLGTWNFTNKLNYYQELFVTFATVFKNHSYLIFIWHSNLHADNHSGNHYKDFNDSFQKQPIF